MGCEGRDLCCGGRAHGGILAFSREALGTFRALSKDIKADIGTHFISFWERGRKSHEDEENDLDHDVNRIPFVLAAFNRPCAE
jgi:hypothetical protein